MNLGGLDLFSAALLLAVALYLIQTGFVFIGTLRLKYLKTRKRFRISILVAVKNEERTVRQCLESLLDLDYPEDLLEIILINDRSTDGTAKILKEYRSTSPPIQTIDLKYSIPGLSGKANAIAQGIERCTGDLILVTDGDCRVPQSWARAHAHYYRDDVGLVAGFTLLDAPHDGTSAFGKVQSLDWAYLLSIGSGAIGMRTPLSVLGNNFSFRRRAYEEVGGYRNMGFSIIEDFALMKTLVKRTAWRVLYPIDSSMLVYSHPMPGVREFYHQRKRWAAGGKEVGHYGKFLMLIALVVHILLPSALVFLPASVAAAAWAVVLGSDFALLWRTTGLVHRRDLLQYFPLWEAFYFFYTVIFTPVLLLPTTVLWKNVTYSWRFNWRLKRMEGN